MQIENKTFNSHDYFSFKVEIEKRFSIEKNSISSKITSWIIPIGTTS